MSSYRLVSDARDVADKYAPSTLSRGKGKKKASKKNIPLHLLFGENNTAPAGDILAPYYESKLPPPEDLGLEEEDFPTLSSGSLTSKQKSTIQSTADQIIERALTHLCVDSKHWSEHVLLKCDDILSLQAGGDPEAAFRDRLQLHKLHKDTIREMKVFPRHCAVAVTFSSKNQAAHAFHALQGQDLKCNRIVCSYMLRFPSKQQLLAFKDGVPQDVIKAKSPGDMPVITAVPVVSAANWGVDVVSKAELSPDMQCEEADEYLASLLG